MKFSNYKPLNDIAILVPQLIHLNGEQPIAIEYDLNNWNNFNNVNIKKQKPNDKCQCNSGLKFKKCCRLKQLNNYIKDIENKYSNIYLTSVKLFNNCVAEKLSIINPIEYLQRQDINRLFFKILLEEVNKSEHYDNIIKTSTFKYLNFMYNNYPDGMGNYIEKCKLTKKKYDILEVYYNFCKYNNLI